MKKLPPWLKLLLALAILALCFYAFIALNHYIQLVPQPAPDPWMTPAAK